MACVVVRYHEIALKGGNRQRFVQRLIANLRDATTGLGVRGAESLPGRIVMRLADDAPIDAVCERVAHTFGVANYSAGVELPADLEAHARRRARVRARRAASPPSRSALAAPTSRFR